MTAGAKHDATYPGYRPAAVRRALLPWLCSLLAFASANSWGAEGASVEADQALSQKLDGYVSCINDHSNDVLRSRERYFSWLKPPERGPTGREVVVYGLYELDDPRECGAAIEAAAAMPPSLPELEQAASAWEQALVAAAAVASEANDYYDLENYKDDAMRQGKALHPRLVAAFAAFDAANDVFYGAVVTQQDALAERRLQRLADDPERRLDYLIDLVVDRAKRVMNAAEGVGSKDFQREAFAAAVDDLERAWREFSAYRDANRHDTRDAIRSSSFVDSTFDLLKAAKSTGRRERSGFEFDVGERAMIDANAPQLVDGHPAKLVEEFNDLINSANRTRR